MAIILGLDFETTGTKPEAEDFQVIEVGAVLFNGITKQLIEAHSWLVSQETLVSDSITALTGIDSQMIANEGFPLTLLDDELSYLVERADYLCAHNHLFEKSILDLFFDLAGKKAESKRWIDTMTDLPDGQGNGNLTLVAANHDVLNPFKHRALPDVITMLKVLSRYDFTEVERCALAPSRTLTITIPYAGGEERRAQVKALGYHWNPSGKNWTRVLKEFQVEEAIKKAKNEGFNAVLMEEKTGSKPNENTRC